MRRMGFGKWGPAPAWGPCVSRRVFLAGAGAAVLWPGEAGAQDDAVTFIFISDVHACRMGAGLSPNCEEEGKTDENLLRHIRALNGLPDRTWPDNAWPAGASGLAGPLPGAGSRIGPVRGVVIGGDMTDDGGGQTAEPEEGPQILQFSHRYREGRGPDTINFPVYAGLGNHDLDQDGRPPDTDWYRRELRDYVRLNHEDSVFFKPPVPAENYDTETDCYSWDWGRLHLVQLHRFGGDTRKGAASSLPWLKRDLEANAQGRPVVLFQHYGWDPFSIERWDAGHTTFDDEGEGAPHWWSEEEREALVEAVAPYNVIGIFHGHQHETPMIYRHGALDLFKPKAAFMGGFALARLAGSTFEVALGEASDDRGGVTFTDGFSKAVAPAP